ncbi:MAG: neutral/alkaline non-lysosomal ceramidase N-terminal domain-containing protein [Verrucomicrobiales bacterium]|nr:neutral/alkaline non-lysosomal ceramidase N-terminal domain-containing protein [Verrucomicrobiales bacterium]
MKKIPAVLLLLLIFAPLIGAQQAEPDRTGKGAWKIGIAKANVTPDEFIFMAGYGGRKTPADGKLTNLWGKALAMQDAKGNRSVVITLDLVGIDKETSDRVCKTLKEKHGLERSQIAICTSHTHTGPVVNRCLGPLHYWQLDEKQRGMIEAYAAVLHDKVVDAAGKSLADLKPARVQWGSGKAVFAVNRRENKPYTKVPEWREQGVLKGPVDHDVPVLTVRDPETSKVRAVLFGYACHSTCLSVMQWSGDYPGFAQIELEKKYPGATALFWAGCGADQNPLPRKTVELAKQYGADLANAVEDVVSSPMPELAAVLKTDYREVQAKLAHLPTKAELQELLKSKNIYDVASAKLYLKQIEEKGGLIKTYPYPVEVWKLGNEIDFVFLGGEVVVDYALRLKREISGQRTWVAAYSNDVMAYIPSLRVLKEGGYEGGGSNKYYGLPGLWDESMEEQVITAIKEMAAGKK